MNKRTLWIVVSVVVLALLVPRLLPSKRPAAGGKGGARGGGVVSVTATVLTPQRLVERIVATGTVLASDAVELRAETAGRLVSVQVAEGSRVAKGTLLAKVNDADLQAQLAKANAALALAQLREARQKGLLDKEAISREDYESSLRDLQVAAADVALFSAQIAKTEVRAPFAGRLGLRLVSQGAYVIPGTAITTLVSDRPLKVDFRAPQKYAGRIRLSDAVLLTADNRGRTYHATVYAIDPMIDESTRSLRLRAVCADPDQALVPGAFVQVTLGLGQDSSALMVPSSALVPDAAGQKVFCVRGGAATPVAVETGTRDSLRVQITTGLQAGDTVVTRGVLLVRPGAAVQITALE